MSVTENPGHEGDPRPLVNGQLLKLVVLIETSEGLGVSLCSLTTL